jgi:transcriptional regulator with XRE-family HTH domain
VADELRSARLQSGLSQSAVANAAGISRAELSRIERAAAPWITIECLARVAVVVGLAPSLKLYPDGSPLRDRGHVALLQLLRLEVPEAVRMPREVPLRIPGDRRAWDAVLVGPDWEVPVEAETRIHDSQALERRVALKQRDDGRPVVVLLVADTRANRRALAVATGLRESFPLGSREILAALRVGRPPSASGILLL